MTPLVEQLAGVCLSGGPDLDPAAYGADRHPRLGPVEPELDAFELAVVRRADALGLPVLGICRGCQVLNVARGGTLHQHVPDVADGSVAHRQTESGRETTHDIRIEPDSRLAEIVGPEDLAVNAFHHQAVDRLGDAACAPWRGRRRDRRGRSRATATRSTSASSGTSRRSCTCRATRACSRRWSTPRACARRRAA